MTGLLIFHLENIMIQLYTLYQQCAVTKEHSIPALEAAHIKPYSLGGFHEINNGLLLRADIRKLVCTPAKSPPAFIKPKVPLNYF